MRQYHAGDRGEPVRDIQQRLDRLGFPIGPDPSGEFGSGTEAAVEQLQRSRGLRVDGIVGPRTWQALVDAGYRLGDRSLYRRVPMMRGDDVAALQQALNSLGFDAGKVDGLFGPNTLAALLDFQHNRHMAEDGIVGSEVVRELALMQRETSKRGREAVREQAWIASFPRPIAGARIYIDPACDIDPDATWDSAMALAAALREVGAMPLLSRSIDTRPDETTRARRANRLDADLVLSITTAPPGAATVFHFGSDLSTSHAGRALAAAIGRILDLPVAASTAPMLRETRSPAVVVASAEPTEVLGSGIGAGVVELYTRGVPQENSAR